MNESSRGPRFSRGRGRGDHPTEGSSGQGRKQHNGSKERGRPSTERTGPVLLQRREGGASGGGGGGGEERGAGRQTSKQSRNVDKNSSAAELDDFSAALQALPKMKLAEGGESSAEKAAQFSKDNLAAERGREKHAKTQPHSKGEREKQPSPPKKKEKKRDLSPSVAAMFDAVSASQQSSSDVVSDDTDAHEEGPTATLKSMLHIQGAPSPTATTAVAPPPTINPRMPDALQKLFRGHAPPTAPRQFPVVGVPPPRGPLLPYPGYQQTPPPQIPLGGRTKLCVLSCFLPNFRSVETISKLMFVCLNSQLESPPLTPLMSHLSSVDYQ